MSELHQSDMEVSDLKKESFWHILTNISDLTIQWFLSEYGLFSKKFLQTSWRSWTSKMVIRDSEYVDGHASL